MVGRHLEGGIDRVGGRGRPDGPVQGPDPRRRRARVRGAAGTVEDVIRSVVGLRRRSEPDGQLVGDPLGHLARVDEDEGCPVLEDVGGDAVQHVREL